MNFSIGHGLPISSEGAPMQVVSAPARVGSVNIGAGEDSSLRLEVLVAEGQHVAAGQAVCRDRRRPGILFTAPVSGTVARVSTVPRRGQTSVTIIAGPGEARRFDIPGDPDRHGARKLLMESGMWPALIARPFGRIPDPDARPDAIFVTAIDTNPLAVDPAVVLDSHARAFERAIGLLKLLTDGLVFVCQGAGSNLAPEDSQLRCVRFRGAHPAGLAGTHIDRLIALRRGRSVWQIHYQDVIAIGRLLEEGKVPGERVVSLAGPGVRRPRLVRVPSGADLDDLVKGELTEGEKRILSGPPLGGRESRFLGRHHWQVCVLAREGGTDGDERRWPSWPRSAVPRPVVPTEALEHALGPDIPVIPLVRALSIGDLETAERLGCLGLLEEDMALITYVTGGIQDFGALLRSVLDNLEAAA